MQIEHETISTVTPKCNVHLLIAVTLFGIALIFALLR
jgi:hypothetical protein